MGENRLIVVGPANEQDVSGVVLEAYALLGALRGYLVDQKTGETKERLTSYQVLSAYSRVYEMSKLLEPVVQQLGGQVFDAQDEVKLAPEVEAMMKACVYLRFRSLTSVAVAASVEYTLKDLIRAVASSLGVSSVEIKDMVERKARDMSYKRRSGS